MMMAISCSIGESKLAQSFESILMISSKGFKKIISSA